MPVSRVFMGIVLVAGAVVLLFEDVPFSVVVGGVVVIRGLVMTVRILRRTSDTERREGLVGAALMLVTGVVVIVVPDTAVLAVRAGLGVGCMALGGLMIHMGLRRSSPTGDQPAQPSEGSRLAFDHRSAPRLVNEWLLKRRMDPDSRGELVETLFFEPPNKASKLASFWVMMILATGIATFALIQDSTAVVIGAMLVAPLMGPIMGVSAAAVNGWGLRLVRSLLLVVVAAAAAVFMAWLISSWLPSVGDIATNTQITSRVEPSLLDFCVAVFAGAAGAYATVDPRVSSSLSGVAIAVALVPPLAVVGITLEQSDYESSLGALLLFSTNVVSIVLAAVTVFVLMGFAALPPDRDQRARLRRVIGVFGAGALVILMPLSITSEDLWTEASNEGAAQRAVEAWLPSDGSVEFVSVESEGDTLEISLSGPELPENTDDLLDRLTDRLEFKPKVTMRLSPSETTTLD
ncbi:MAG: TIGR00341 family protein [Microthrixaceae bacterium]